MRLWSMLMGSAALLKCTVGRHMHSCSSAPMLPLQHGKHHQGLGQHMLLGTALPVGVNPAALRSAADGASRLNTLALQADSGWLAKVTGAWQAAKISNLDYLLYCNLAAGRSFNDLTQVSGRAAEALSHQHQQIGALLQIPPPRQQQAQHVSLDFLSAGAAGSVCEFDAPCNVRTRVIKLPAGSVLLHKHTA